MASIRSSNSSILREMVQATSAEGRVSIIATFDITQSSFSRAGSLQNGFARWAQNPFCAILAGRLFPLDCDMTGENGKIGAKSASIWGICPKLARAYSWDVSLPVVAALPACCDVAPAK